MAVFRLSTSVFSRKHYFSHTKYKGGFNIWWFGIYTVDYRLETTEINAFIHQGCIKLIKSHSQDMYNVVATDFGLK